MRTKATARSSGGIALGMVAALLGGLLAAAAPAAAAAPPATVDEVRPMEGTAIAVARVAAPAPGESQKWKLKASFDLRNTSTMIDLTLAMVQLEYPGGPATLSIPWKPPVGEALPAEEDTEIRVRDGIIDPDDDIVSAIERDLPMPIPPTVRVHFWFREFPDPATFEYPLVEYENKTPKGAYFFPAAAEDLDPGEYWYFRARHVDTQFGSSQRYAYDVKTVKWVGGDAGKWSTSDPARPTKNEDYFVWDKPIYAMADGLIKFCRKSDTDNALEEDGVAGGNGYWIEHDTGEMALYAHMKAGSVEDAGLCPVEEDWGIDVPVKAGQQIGRVGNSGKSGAPHLHVHVQKGQPVNYGGTEDGEDGLPLRFINMLGQAGDTGAADVPNPPDLARWSGLTLHRFSLVRPNPCGFKIPAPGAVEVARHGVPDECWQDVFNMITWAGYRPVWVDGYDVGGQTFFNGVFRSGPMPTAAFHGLDGNEYQDAFDKWTGKGYRLHQVDAYRSGNSIRYAAIFTKRSGPSFSAYHGLTAAEHQAKFESLKALGYAPVNVSVVSIGGIRYYAALYERMNVGGFALDSTILDFDYQDVYDEQKALGRRLAYVNGYTHNGQAYLSAIFWGGLMDPLGAKHGLDSDAYQDEWQIHTGQGLWTRAVTGYEHVGHRFAVLWRARPNTTIGFKPPAMTSQTSATFTFTASVPGANFECRLDGAAYAECTTPRSYNNLAAGSHTFRVRAVDREGLADATPAAYSWLIDVTAPVVNLIRPVTGHMYVNDVELNAGPPGGTLVIGALTVRATALDAESGIGSVEFRVDGVPVPAAEVDFDPNTGEFSFVHSGGSPGEHDIEARATNGAGLVGADSITITTPGGPGGP